MIFPSSKLFMVEEEAYRASMPEDVSEVYLPTLLVSLTNFQFISVQYLP